MIQKNDPRRGTPSVRGRLARALGRSWAALEHGTLITTIFVLFSCGSWAHLGVVLGGQDNPKNSAKTTHDASKMRPRQPKIRFSAKKVGKNEPFEFGWHFPFDFSPILFKNTYSNFEYISKII